MYYKPWRAGRDENVLIENWICHDTTENTSYEGNYHKLKTKNSRRSVINIFGVLHFVAVAVYVAVALLDDVGVSELEDEKFINTP